MYAIRSYYGRVNAAKARSGTGNIDDQPRQFTAGHVADPLLFERNPRAGGGGHCPGAAGTRPEQHVDRGDLALRLDERASQFRQFAGHVLGDVALGSDRITRNNFV